MSFGKGSAQTPTYNPGNQLLDKQGQIQQIQQQDANDPFKMAQDVKALGNGAYVGGQVSPYQQAAGQDSAGSHVGLNGAFGSSNWTQDPTSGQWTQSQSFNPALQSTVNNLQGQIGAQSPLSSATGQPALQQAENAAYGQATSRLDPQFAQQQESLQARLAAQGLDPSSQAAQNAQGNFDRAKTDAYQTAQNNAVGQGLAAQGQMFGQQQQANTQPYQQLAGLQGLLGNAQGLGAANGPNYLGAVGMQGNFNIGQANMQNQAAGQAWQGAGAAAGGAFALSDERAKQRIEPIGQDALPGVPFVLFEYRHEPGVRHVGVLAQDLHGVRPDLVRARADGLLEVDYAGLQRSIR